MNPNALDRTAAWLLNMNVQFVEEESSDPEPKHRDKSRSKDEFGQGEKVTPGRTPRRILFGGRRDGDGPGQTPPLSPPAVGPCAF